MGLDEERYVHITTKLAAHRVIQVQGGAEYQMKTHGIRVWWPSGEWVFVPWHNVEFVSFTGDKPKGDV